MLIFFVPLKFFISLNLLTWSLDQLREKFYILHPQELAFSKRWKPQVVTTFTNMKA